MMGIKDIRVMQEKAASFERENNAILQRRWDNGDRKGLTHCNICGKSPAVYTTASKIYLCNYHISHICLSCNKEMVVTRAKKGHLLTLCGCGYRRITPLKYIKRKRFEPRLSTPVVRYVKGSRRY
jgi:hypothetical protein